MSASLAITVASLLTTFAAAPADAPSRQPAFVQSSPAATATLPALTSKDVQWLVAPNGETISRNYPERALRLGTSGWASIRCTIAGQRLANCETVGESNPKDGFGNALLKSSAAWVLSAREPDIHEGRAIVVEGRFKPWTPPPSPLPSDVSPTWFQAQGQDAARPPAPASGQAELVVIRDWAEPILMAVTVALDEQKAATLWHHSYTVLHVPAGPHLLSVRWPFISQQPNYQHDVILLPERRYYVAVDSHVYNNIGGRYYRTTATRQIPQAEAEAIIQHCCREKTPEQTFALATSTVSAPQRSTAAATSLAETALQRAATPPRAASPAPVNLPLPTGRAIVPALALVTPAPPAPPEATAPQPLPLSRVVRTATGEYRPYYPSQYPVRLPPLSPSVPEPGRVLELKVLPDGSIQQIRNEP